MNGVDYTKHLNREREYVKDTVSKTQKEADKRVADANERNEASEAKLRQKHLEDRAELESKYQKSLDNLKQKQADALEGNGNNFQEDLDKQRAEFQAKKDTQSKDFDQRLNDIKSSYKKSFESERELHHHVQDMDKEKYQKNISELQDKHHSEIGKYGDRMKEAGSGIKDTFNRERQQLVRAQEDQVSDVYKSERKKQNDLSNRIRREIETTKEAHEAEKAHGRDYMEQKLSKMERMHQDRNLAMAHEYSQKNSELAEKEKNQALETNRQHQQQLAEVTRDYNKSLRHIENERRRHSMGGDELKEVREKQQGLSGQALQRNQIRQLNQLMAKDKVASQKVISDMNDTFREDMKARGADYSAGLQKKENQANAEKLLDITHEREKAQKKTDILEKQNLTNKEDFERGLNYERNASADKINNLKLHFNKSMNELEDKMRLSADEMKRANKEDKDAFIKQTNERQIKDLQDMKRNVARSMDKTIESYESRIAAYQRENENLRRTMDQKISDVVDYADKKLESQKRLYEERRQAELNDQKIAMDQREHHIKQDTNSIIVNFQKKLDKLQVENDSKIKLLTHEYENKLKELAERNSKEKALGDAAHKLEVDNLKQTYAIDKANLIATFESNVEGLKAGHEEQMNQMKNFKKLS